MSVRSAYYVTSADKKTLIHVNQWTPLCREIRGVVQIAHGVSEYGARYAPFADYLCRNGFVVVANDHLGHGHSCIEGRPMVYLGDENGWNHAVEDMETIRKITKQVFPEKPYFLFGHSMGSFLARTHLIQYPGVLDGCVLCGTGHMNPLIVAAGKLVADRESKRLGRTAYSERIDQLAFGMYNKRFAPNRTPFDWLSANEENVDAYCNDPLCGGRTTLGLFRDMMDGIGIIIDRTNMEKMDKNLPVFFIAGDQDPVGNMGKGVETAYRCFQKVGMHDVSCKLYHGLRHEILNETGRQYIFLDVLNWLKAHC